MALIENSLYGVIDRVADAIKLLKELCPPDGYYVAFSGGKDSIVIKDLVIKSGVKYDIHYSVTTVDPPELIRYIREYHPDVIWDYPEISMYKLIVLKKMPPTKRVRYCCEYLKERGGEARSIIMGIRREESIRRSKRKLIEFCNKKSKINICPILEWSESDVWEYIKINSLPYCCLYDEGFKRIGCVGCPMAGKKRIKDFERYPKFKKAYIKAFDKMIKQLTNVNNNWKTGEDVFRWWMEEDSKEDESGTLFEDNNKMPEGV